MAPYVVGNKIYLSVLNIEEFKELVSKANEQAEELRKTINKLNNFDLEVELSVKRPEDTEKAKTDNPKVCGECRFYSERNYRCHSETGTEAKCGMGYMNEDMRDKSFRKKLYPGCKLD